MHSTAHGNASQVLPSYQQDRHKSLLRYEDFFAWTITSYLSWGRAYGLIQIFFLVLQRNNRFEFFICSCDRKQFTAGQKYLSISFIHELIREILITNRNYFWIELISFDQIRVDTSCLLSQMVQSCANLEEFFDNTFCILIPGQFTVTCDFNITQLREPSTLMPPLFCSFEIILIYECDHKFA